MNRTTDVVQTQAGRSSYASVRHRPLLQARCGDYLDGLATLCMETNMGKYVIAWILGVPAVIVVLAYVFIH
jgi:hypothetical protein